MVHWLQWVLIGFVVIAGLASCIKLEGMRRRNMIKYWSRTCTGKNWKDRFPNVPALEIREYLEDFVDAFAFSSKKRLKFAPDDKIMEIYKAQYPEKCLLADSYEIETLAFILKDKYRIDLHEIETPDMTLGELFNCLLEKKSQP